MNQNHFSQILECAPVDPLREYKRLYDLFYTQRIDRETSDIVTIRDCCAFCFMKSSFRGTCLSLKDFDESHGYNFKKSPKSFAINYLISFCEYSYNLVANARQNSFYFGTFECDAKLSFYVQQVETVIDNLGYTSVFQNGVTDFVPKDQAAISVAELIDPSLSYKVIEYNHHSMEGDLERKRAVLLALADRLEPQRAKLKQINKSLEDDLFFLLNNVNIRHNNSEQGGKNVIPFVATLEENQIEQWYDETYQMCLLAFLELDHLERKERVKELKKNV